MDTHVKELYCQFSENAPNGHFHKVIPLHDSPDLTWKKISKVAPNLPKGWYELSRLSSKDRIDFLHDFWMSKLTFQPHLSESIDQFFRSLDDIGVFVTQKIFDSPFEAHLVYSISNDGGFFHGERPATPEEITKLQKLFPDSILPEDYLTFLQIHNGFSKSTDTGLLPTYKMEETYQKLQNFLVTQDALLTPKGKIVEPTSLIPFYESFGLQCYHCFWKDWYPAQEMGNIYYSGQTHSISDCKGSDPAPEDLTFPTFNDWLMFYLESVVQ